MRIALLALALLLVLPAVASAKPGLKLVATNGSAPVGQGGGWVLETRAGAVRLTNERDGRLIARALTATCPTAYALRFPRLLLACGDEAAFMDARTGAISLVPRRPRALGIGCESGPYSYSRFGKHWLSTGCAGHNGTWIGLYLNWRTGEQVAFREGSIDDDAPTTAFRDLDDPDLPAREFARCPGSAEWFSARPRWIALEDEAGVRVRRCAGGPSIFLRGAIGATILGDRVAWHTPEKIAVRDLRSRRTYRWNAPGTDQRGGYTTRVSLTERSLWVEVPQGSGPGPSYLVYRARLP